MCKHSACTRMHKVHKQLTIPHTQIAYGKDLFQLMQMLPRYFSHMNFEPMKVIGWQGRWSGLYKGLHLKSRKIRNFPQFSLYCVPGMKSAVPLNKVMVWPSLELSKCTNHKSIVGLFERFLTLVQLNPSSSWVCFIGLV